MELSKELGLMLYWGEGDKTKNYFVALTNTNPDVLFYFVSWLRKYFELDESKLKLRLYLWDDLDELRAKKFWSKLLGIPIANFTKSYLSHSKAKIRKRKHEYGVCRVSYGSKKMMSEIMKEIKDNFVC
jgi:hypothetical protein